MTKNYSWSVVRMQHGDIAGLANVVTEFGWSLTVSEGEATPYTATGIYAPSPPDPDSFTAFADLTEAQVFGWIDNDYRRVAEMDAAAEFDRRAALAAANAGEGTPW